MRVALLHAVVGQDMAVDKFGPRSVVEPYKDRSATISLMGTCEVGAVYGKTSSVRGDCRKCDGCGGGSLNMSGPRAS